MDNKDIKILEAILFASGEPLDENDLKEKIKDKNNISCLLYTSPSPRDTSSSRMPSSA